MRRRRPAPLGEKGASIVPLSRAHRGRVESDDSSTDGATALELREETRSKFPELTNAVSTLPDATSSRPARPTAPRGQARARRATGATEPHDGWTFVLIPPGVGARPRTLRISVRRLRFVVASFLVVFGSTALTGGLLVLALSFLPPAQDEVRGVELGVFASATEPPPDSGRDTVISPAAIAAASAGAAAPRTPPTRPRAARPVGRASDDTRTGNGSSATPSIMETLPVVGEITSRFARARRHPLLGVVRRHAGIDIAAPAGTHITAPAAGVVRFSGRKFGYGYTVEIDHGDGVVTRYAHCRSLVVRVGDEVAAGAVIATVGRSGLATAPHLHYEVLVRGRNVNPLRTPLASLLEGKPAPPAAPQPPADSAMRAPAPSDAAAPDVPVLPMSPGDTIEDAPPPVIVSRTPVATGLLPDVIPMPATAARDSALKS